MFAALGVAANQRLFREDLLISYLNLETLFPALRRSAPRHLLIGQS